MFFGILIFDQKWPPSKGYRLCKIVDFGSKIVKMHRIFGVFKNGFLRNTSAVVLCKKRISTCFLEQLIFDPNESDFAKLPLQNGRFSSNRLISRIFGVF